ncbi:VCBS domain-containing protein [Vibrio splendidus]
MSTSGTLTSTDVDNPDNTFTPDSITGTNGDLTIDANGHWNFTANNAFNQLNVGDKVEETFTVNSVDGTPSTIKVTINGTNDAATVSSATVSVDETNKAVSTSGTLTSTDVDNPDNAFTPDSVSGTNGDLTIDANGHWTFTANSAFNQLNVGDKVEETFTVSSIDGTPSTIKVTINGTNDAATVSTATIAVDETDTAISTSGTLTSTDVDNPDNEFTPDSITGTNGDLTIDANGHWTFTANSAFNQLNVGDKVEETFTVASVDGTPSTIKVTINGTNDKATVSTATVSVDETDTAISTSGTLTSTDVDNPDNAFTAASLTGTNGDLTIDANGHWTFTANSAFNQLNVGDKVTETFNVTSVDGTPSTITVTINGTNDQAMVSSATVVVDETDTAVSTSGTLTSTDVDNPDNAFTPDSITGTNGDLTIDANGNWTFTANSAFNQLNVGDKVSEIFNVTSVDGTLSTVTVTINGTNDIATLSSELKDLTETDAVLSTGGQLTITDPDAVDATVVAQTNVAGTYGHFSIGTDGAWTYQTDTAVDALNANQVVQETFTVENTDGTQATVTVNIMGTNDAAMITGTATGTLTEDINVNAQNKLYVSGQLNITDADAGESGFNYHGYNHTALHGSYGKLNISSDGHWGYSADNTQAVIQALGAGQQLTDTIQVTSKDGTTQDIVITINGTNDVAVITGKSSGVVTEESQLHTSGTLNVTDVDTGEAHFSNTDIAGQLGTLHLTDAGAWTYDLDNTNPSVQALGQGKTATDVITVHSSDGTPHQITITVNGTNDAAIIKGTDIGSVDEGHGKFSDMSPDYGKSQLTSEALYADGKLTITDPDAGENTFDPKNGGYDYQGQYGRINLHQDGAWHYMVDIGHNGFTSGTSTTSVGTTIDQLGEGQSLTDTITVFAKDGTSHDIVVTIHGDNDKPYCSSEVQLSSGKEDTAQILTLVQLLQNTVDVDANDVGKLSIENLHADHGSIALNTDGTYTFTPTQNYNGLVHFTYDIKDAHGGVTHTGATTDLAAVGDTAIIKGDDKGDVSEHQNPNMSPDYAQPGMGKLWNNTLHESGQLSITDADVGEASFVTHGSGYGYHGQYGKLHLNGNGFWSYVVDNNSQSSSGRTIDALGAGQTITDTITVESKDGTTHDITITIHGDNDRPYCSSEVQLNSGTEDTRQTITITDLLQNTVDVDHNDAGLLTIENLHANHGSIAINKDGSFSFTPEKDYNGDVHFTYDVKDGHGGVTHTGATTSLVAVADDAKIGGTDTASLEEFGDHTSALADMTDHSPDYLQEHQSKLFNQILSAKGHLTITDPDIGEAEFQWKPTINGQYGHLSIWDNGNWVYEVSAGNSAAGRTIDKLGEGEELTDTMTVHSKDGTPHDIVITIHGDNDRPYCSSEVILNAGTEDTRQTITVAELLQNTVDVDHNDTGLLTIENLHANHGSIAINKDGSFSFTPEKDYNGDVHFTYDVKDAHGGVTHTGATTSLVAVADSAKIGGTDTASLEEFGDRTSALADMTDHSPDYHQEHQSKLFNQILSAKGHLTITDPDIGEAEFQWKPTINGQYGHLSIWDNGNWVYEVSAGNSAAGRAIDKLGEGEELTDTMTVHSKDGTPHDIVITIHGDNDRPYCSSEVILNAGTEDTRQNITVADLLQNTVDVDQNDAGLLTIENLHANHGSIAINKDGSFSFTPDKDYNGPVHFTYDVKDGHGGVTHTGATTNLAAVNDAAIIKGDDTADVHEDALGNQTQYGAGAGGYGYDLTISGKLDIVDPDQSEDNFPQGHGSSTWYTGDHGGQLIIGATGSWTYNINNAAPSIQRLGLGESMVDTVQVHSADGTTHNIAITIHGTNDAPVLAAQSHSVTEGGSLLKGTMIATDVDHGDSQIFSISNAVDGLTFNADGSYSFDPSNTAYQHLANGQTQTLTIPVTVTDSAGATDTQNLAITITGTNDASVLANGLASTTVTEDQTSSANQLSSSWQNLAITDVDSTAEAAIVQIEVNGVLHQVPADFAMNLQGDHGTFHTTHGTDGYDKWRYTADNTHSEIQGLKDGQSLTDSITLITADGTRIPITATIQGSDDHVIIDTPNAVTASLGTAIEDTKTSISGMLAAHDVDTDDSVYFEVQNTAGSYGSLSVSQDGSWHYDLDPAKANPLTPWDNIPEIFNVVAVSSDGSKTTQRIQVNVQGTSDAAIIKGVDTGSITEDHHIGSSSPHTIAVSGLLTVSDPDAGQDHFQFSQFGEQVIHDPFGGYLRITPSGNWGYSVKNSALQYLHEGDVEHVVYRVHSADGTAHDITITVTGTNDAPALAAQTQSVTEDGSALQGQMQATDADYNAQAFLSFAIANPVDGLTFNSDGSYSFDPSNGTYQHLVNGQNQTLTIPVTVTDSAGATDIQNLAITITGTNDQPTITSQSISSNEDTGYQFTAANFGFTDVDTGDTLDHISITSLPDAIQGQLLLNGVAVTANQDISEADIAHLTFNPAANFNGDVHFGYTVNDGHVDSTPANAILTVTAVNDIPTVTQASVVATTNEDTPITLTTAEVLQGIGAQDIEGDTLTISSLSVDHATGTLVDNQDGTYTITPNANFHGIIPLTGMVSDGTASTPFANKLMVSSVTDPVQVALSMTAEQQVITLGQSGTGSVMNQGQLQTGDHITQLAFEFNIIGGPQVDSHGIHGATFLSYGVPNEENEFYAWQPSNLTIKIGNSGDIATGINTADGQTHRYSILWDSSSGHLEVLVDGVSQFSQDNVAKGYEIPGHGVLALAQDQDHYAEEHGTAAIADHGFSPADAYHGQVFSASVATNTQVDKTLLEHAPLNTVVDKDHGLVIDMQMNPQGQAIDMTGHHQLSIAGDTSSSTVNIDTLVATPNTNALLHLHPQITAPTDPDDHMSSLKISGLLAGTVLSDGHGNSETISNMQQAIEIKDWDLDHLTAQLPGGNKHNMNVVLEATTSGSSGDVTSQSSSPLILDPNNPIPNAQISGSDQGQTSEDSSFSAVLTVNDPDGSLQGTFTDETLHGKYGDLHMGADGHWVYTPGAKAQTLNVGDSTYEKFVVHSADGTDHTIKMTVTGENDTATITGLSKGSVYEDTNPVTTTHLHVNDVDKGEDHFQSATMHGAYGAATISQDGMFTYTLNSSSPSVQALGVGETMTDIVTVTSTDGTIQQSVTVTIYGSNDEPTVSSAVTLANGTENTDVVINSVELLSNASDIDNNDQGQLSISSISADHGTITDNHDGTFTLHPDPHYNGRVSLSYDIIDGHSGSVTTSATLDLAAVTPPLTVTLTNDTGTNATDNISKDGHLTIAGQEPGSKIEYSIDGGNTWSSKFAPTEGVNHAQVRQTDAAGNSSPATSFDFTYDTTKPIFTVNHTQDSNQPQYAISGTSSSDTASMTVEIVNSTTHQKIQTLHPTVDAHGDWHLTSPYLTDGSYSLNIYGVDKAGNHTSQYHGAVHDSFTIDTHVAPLTISLTHDTGTSDSDLITNDGSLTITGQEHYAHIEYSADGGMTWTNTFTPQTGSNTVEARQTDAVGNTSMPTSFTFILDNQVSAPLVGLAHDTGSSDSDLLTNNGALTVVPIEANAVVEYSIDNGQHWTSIFSPAEGVNNVQVRQTDGAGNVSPSVSISYTLDTNADIRVHAVDTPKGNEIDSIQLYMSQDVTPTSIKLVDEHGNSVDVDPTMQHGFSSSIKSPDHNYLTYRHIDVSTLSGHIHVEVDGVDTAGNTVQDHSGSESVDKAPIPSQPLAQTGIGSSLQADISVHSLSQPNGDIIETMQLYMTQNMTLTSIKLVDEHGHTVTVDPSIHNDNGASVKQPDHEILAFKHIDVSTLSGHIHVEVDGVDSAGNTVQDHSGSQAVDKAPILSQAMVQHDVPDDVDSFTVDLISDSATETHFDISGLQGSHMHSEQSDEVTPTTGASAYLDALGISPHVWEGDTQQQALPDDIDIVLAQADQLAAEHDLSIGPDISDALAQDDHQHQVKHNDDQDNIEHHHIEDLPDIDPNS